MTTIICSSNIISTEDLFRTFANNNSISIADETFDSISQLLSAYRNLNAEPYHHIKDEIVRLCNLIIENNIIIIDKLCYCVKNVKHFTPFVVVGIPHNKRIEEVTIRFVYEDFSQEKYLCPGEKLFGIFLDRDSVIRELKSTDVYKKICDIDKDIILGIEHIRDLILKRWEDEIEE